MLKKSRSSWRSAVSGVTMLGIAAGTTATAIGVSTASLSPAQAQSVFVTPPVVVTPSSKPPVATSKLDEKLCDGVLEIAAEYFEAAKQIGKPPSRVLVNSMLKWADEGCPYPYKVDWTVRPGDTDKANLDSTIFVRFSGELRTESRKDLDVTRRLNLPDISFSRLGIQLSDKPTFLAPSPVTKPTTKPTASIGKQPS